MSVQKKNNGKWLVSLKPNTRYHGPRVRRQFDKKSKALAYEAAMLSKYSKPEIWENEQKTDERTLLELMELWFLVKGNTLADAHNRRNVMTFSINQLGNPIAEQFTNKMFSDYRAMRLRGTPTLKAVKPSTANRELAYIRSMFNELISQGHWDGDNPVSAIKTLKEPDSELTYYNIEQLKHLFRFLKESDSEHVEMVVKVCLAVGARWDEAESLRPGQIKGGRIQFSKTKTGKRRIIPISKELEQELSTHNPFSSERMFSKCLTAFRLALKRSKLPSPKGQLTHVLRHSFAVGFMEQGGNLVDLMNTLGHANIQTTSIYLKFAPTHLKDVPLLSPLNQF